MEDEELNTPMKKSIAIVLREGRGKKKRGYATMAEYLSDSNIKNYGIDCLNLEGRN